MKKLIITALLIGAGFGGYALLHKTPVHVAYGTCNPKGKCTACKNCSGCKNCSKNGGTCSVCR